MHAVITKFYTRAVLIALGFHFVCVPRSDVRSEFVKVSTSSGNSLNYTWFQGKCTLEVDVAI